MRTVSAKKYYNKEKGEYRFPFKVLDDTPGGKNLGRIEVCIELFRSKKTDGRYHIEKLWFWFGQTRDKRYHGKTFEIPCHSDSIRGTLTGKTATFMSRVWRVFFCDEHRNPVFEAYPADGHKELVINNISRTLLEIVFE